MAKKKAAVICDGTIETAKIKECHQKIKTIVDRYVELNKEINDVTTTVKENWVGKGANEFESQYKILICKIDDFGDTLKEIYDALVEAEAAYAESDDSQRQGFAKTLYNMGAN